MLYRIFLIILCISYSSLPAQAESFENDDIPQEKCYCISKAGQNDGTGEQVSPGSATKDYDCNDWKYVARGSCEAIGGSKIPGKAAPKDP